jgi:hypothetical protein
MIILLKCDVWASKGLLKRQKMINMLLVCSGGLDVKTIKSIRNVSIYELFRLPLDLGTKPL